MIEEKIGNSNSTNSVIRRQHEEDLTSVLGYREIAKVDSDQKPGLALKKGGLPSGAENIALVRDPRLSLQDDADGLFPPVEERKGSDRQILPAE